MICTYALLLVNRLIHTDWVFVTDQLEFFIQKLFNNFHIDKFIDYHSNESFLDGHIVFFTLVYSWEINLFLIKVKLILGKKGDEAPITLIHHGEKGDQGSPGSDGFPGPRGDPGLAGGYHILISVSDSLMF